MKPSALTLILVFFLFCISQMVVAQPTPLTELATAPLELHEGDTIVFLGDLITHQCLYTQYLEDYFYTRFPERRIHCHNAGVSGDRAADALSQRLLALGRDYENRIHAAAQPITRKCELVKLP